MLKNILYYINFKKAMKILITMNIYSFKMTIIKKITHEFMFYYHVKNLSTAKE